MTYRKLNLFYYFKMLLSKSIFNPRPLQSQRKRYGCRNIFLSSRLQKDIKFPMPKRYGRPEKNIWNASGELAAKYNPINLGSGSPDFVGPKYITDAFGKAAGSTDWKLQQYTRGNGHPRLVEALSKMYSPLIGQQMDPNTDILVTIGATEGLYCAIAGHVDVGEEVIVIEPAFDCYLSMITAVSGVPRPIPLRVLKSTKGDVITAADYVLDPDELTALFNCKTKALILNNPHNPVGKVFALEELEFIAALCNKWNVLCISDEVYEWTVSSPNCHVRIGSLPGMWDKTITLGTCGKAFSLTGWKLGWAYGPADLMNNLFMIHQNCVYACPTACQEALAVGFETELRLLGKKESSFTQVGCLLRQHSDILVQNFPEFGIHPVVPQGSYFLIANWTCLASDDDIKSESDEHRDFRFMNWCVKNVGILFIPVTVFCSDCTKGLFDSFVRVTYIKKEETLNNAVAALKKWSKKKNKCG